MFSSSSSGLPDILLRWDALPEATVVQGLPRMRAKAGSAPDLGDPAGSGFFVCPLVLRNCSWQWVFFSILFFYFFYGGSKKVNHERGRAPTGCAARAGCAGRGRSAAPARPAGAQGVAGRA